MAEFYPRLNDNGIVNNPLWYSNNPFYNAGYGLPNCTCYAWGRFWEIGGGSSETRPRLSTGNAQDWWNYNDGYQRGQQIELGAVVCYAGGDYSGLGHVAVVEQIFDNYAVVSNSEYGGSFWKLTNISLNGQFPYGHYTFQGFIYNPNGGGKPSGAGNKIWLFKRKLWRIEHEY